MSLKPHRFMLNAYFRAIRYNGFDMMTNMPMGQKLFL